MKPIAAAYATKAVYQSYCPPLRPLQIRDYLLRPESRKAVVKELQRARSFSDGTLAPLRAAVRQVTQGSRRDRKEILLRFLRDFSRYHRDLENRPAPEAGPWGPSTSWRTKRSCSCRRRTASCTSFPLPEERAKEEKAIISHVIVKADIRGSVDIAHTMKARGLNPAAYFSLNFFDPISEVLAEYDAAKVFLEGDAIILSIFEHQDTARGWYGVARACGLAVSILQIVQQYNAKNRTHDLPILELGIGICYEPTPPAFLFDGDTRIMISERSTWRIACRAATRSCAGAF